MKKLWFFTGKGGVGKSTLACAFALELCEVFPKVVLVSVDPAHSTSDLLADVGPKNLELFEISPEKEREVFVEEAIETIRPFLKPDVLKRGEKILKDLSLSPGAEEILFIDSLSKIVASYEVVVVDGAPSGHTVQLLRRSINTGLWISSLIEAGKDLARDWDPKKKEAYERAMEKVRQREIRLRTLEKTLRSKETVFLPVMIPENMSLLETLRLVETLKKLSLNVGPVLVNRLLPEDAGSSFLKERIRLQKEVLQRVKKYFKDIVTLPMLSKEPKGELLKTLGKSIFKAVAHPYRL